MLFPPLSNQPLFKGKKKNPWLSRFKNSLHLDEFGRIAEFSIKVKWTWSRSVKLSPFLWRIMLSKNGADFPFFNARKMAVFPSLNNKTNFTCHQNNVKRNVHWIYFKVNREYSFQHLFFREFSQNFFLSYFVSLCVLKLIHSVPHKPPQFVWTIRFQGFEIQRFRLFNLGKINLCKLFHLSLTSRKLLKTSFWLTDWISFILNFGMRLWPNTLLILLQKSVVHEIEPWH